MKSTKRTFRGLTLMEALLFLGLAAVVIVGAFSLYNNASNTSKMNQARTELQTYIGGVKSLYATSNDFSSVNTALVVSADIAPSSAVDGSSLINPWGGQTVISGNTRNFEIEFRRIPDEACTALMSSGLINKGSVIGIQANGGTMHNSDIDPGAAIGECGSGNNTLLFRAR